MPKELTQSRETCVFEQKMLRRINKNRKGEEREKGKDVEHILEEAKCNIPLLPIPYILFFQAPATNTQANSVRLLFLMAARKM
jgi:hypothetical protein